MITRRLSIVLLLVLGSTFQPRFAHAQPDQAQDDSDPGPGAQIWVPDLPSDERERRRTEYDLDPDTASPETRLETELQASIDLERLDEAVDRMNSIAVDGSNNDRVPAAEQVFGEGYRVVRIERAPREIWDQYVDTVDGLLDRLGSSMRFRTQRGITGINFKPPGAERFANGMAHRVEGGIYVPPTALTGVRPSERLFAFFRNASLVDNPLREFATLFPGRDLAEFFNAAVEVSQRRSAYEIQRLEGDGSWLKISEMTIDHVTARDANNHDLRVEFGRVELEGDHLNLEINDRQRAALDAAGGGRAHRASDVRHPTFMASQEVAELHELAEVVSSYLGTESPLRTDGMSKYSEARMRIVELAGQRQVQTPLSAGMARSERMDRLVHLRASQRATLARRALTPARHAEIRTVAARVPSRVRAQH